MLNSSGNHCLAAAFKNSIPVLSGYLSIGFAFGFLLVKAGFEWFWAPVMSITVYAGAAQFLAVNMFVQGQSPVEMGLAVLLINARHMVYGFSLLKRFTKRGFSRAYLIFGLTDETYGLLSTVSAPAGCDSQRFDFWIALFNQSYWVLGSVFGALMGAVVDWNARGIEFSMTALFTVLLVEQVKKVKRPEPFVLALLLVVVIYALGLGEHALLLGIVSSAAGCLVIGGRSEHN